MLADLVLIIHLAFVLFVGLGGLLVLRFPRLAWVHVPVALYGALIEFVGFICPLTPLENWLRRRGGEAGYEGGFIEHYITAALYPTGLTREIQVAIGIGVVVLNALIYTVVARRHPGAAVPYCKPHFPVLFPLSSIPAPIVRYPGLSVHEMGRALERHPCPARRPAERRLYPCAGGRLRISPIFAVRRRRAQSNERRTTNVQQRTLETLSSVCRSRSSSRHHAPRAIEDAASHARRNRM